MQNALRRDPGTALKIDAVGKMRHVDIYVEGALSREERAAIALQRAWKERLQYVSLKAITQEKLCRGRREEMRTGLQIDCEPCASSGKKSADIKFRYLKKAWRDTDKLLFEGMPMIQMYDRGDNWNERWQEALSLRNKTDMEKRYRKSSLNAVYADFVHTARTYGRTIISEYFLHEYMKSVRPKKLGGVAGGKKYLWRGILFKLADGSQGPYGGSDEAAAKAAGHELRGASEYLETGVGLSVPPMCLLDYKGFRMLAQAELPIGPNTQKMGTNDGGRTVLNDSPTLNKRTAKAAKKLGLRAHKAGGSLERKRYEVDRTGKMVETKINVGGKMLYAAADVEGHEGKDGRLYLIDLARAFPPEDPSVTPHLSGMLRLDLVLTRGFLSILPLSVTASVYTVNRHRISPEFIESRTCVPMTFTAKSPLAQGCVSAKVVVKQDGQKGESATVTKAHGTLLDYDILYPDGREERGTPVHLLRDLRLFVFYRLMRPEFVCDRGREVLRAAGISPDHKFPKIVISNPMKFAIECAKFPSPKTLSLTLEESRIKHRFTTAAPETMPSVAELPDLSQASIDPATTSAAYETFGGGEESTARYESSEAPPGEGSGDPSAAGGDRSSPRVDGCPSDAAWKRKAMECGIEFVVREDEYYKGFEDFEADEEELRRRGGAGYRPFDPEAEPEPEPDDDPLPGYNGMIEEPDPVVDRTVGGLVPNGRTDGRIGNRDFRGGGSISKSAFDRRLEFPSGGGFHASASVQPAPDSWDGEGSEAGDASDGYSARDDDYGGFDSESNASSILSVSGSGILRMTARFNSTSSTYRKIVPSIMESPNPVRRGRDLSVTSDVRPYDRFSARSLVSRSSRGNSPPGGNRGCFDYQAPLRIGMGVRELSGSSAAGLVSGYDIFKNSSNGSASDLTEDGPHGTNGAFAEGYSAFEPNARNPSNRSLLSPLGRGSPSHGSFLPAYQGMGEPPVGFSAKGRHPRSSTQASKQRGADLGNHTGSHRYLESFAHQRRDEADFLTGVPDDLPPPNQGAYDHFHAEPNRTPRSDFNSAKGLGGEAPLAPPPAPSSHAPSLQQRQSQALNAIDPPPYSEAAAARRGVFAPAEPLGVPGEVEVMVDGEDAADSPVPLSPDALTAFAANDPEAKERNREVTEATQFLLKVVVPSTAKLLCMMAPEALAKVNLASQLHRCGVNMRHIGLLRAYVPHVFKDPDAIKMSPVTCRNGSGPGEGLFSSGSAVDGRRSGKRVGSGREWYAEKSSAAILKDRALVEVLVRTLKLVLREFQRRWMKSEQSSSEQGMHLLVAQFLNLVTGSHKNSEVFWRENVTTGVCQRFGTVALTESERARLWDVCSERPEMLYIILKELVEVTGIRFKETVRRKLWHRRKRLKGFMFDLTSIRDIDPVVTPMAVFEGVIAQNGTTHSPPVEVNEES